MSKVTPPGPAGAERLTWNVKVVAPLVSTCETSVTVRFGSGALHGASGVDVFRGAGVAAAKSVLLLSVSVQPFAPRKIASVVLVAGADAVSEKFAPPQPTRSMICASSPAVHGSLPPLQGMAVVVLARITLPAVAPIAATRVA